MEKRQAESEAQIAAASQNCTMLVLDKKRMKLKESGLPQIVIDQTPWYLKRSKLPIVKCKIGPQIVTMVADESIFDMIPVKTQVKATISGIYITGVRGMRGPLPKPEEKKKGFGAKLRGLYLNSRAKLANIRAEEAGTKKK